MGKKFEDLLSMVGDRGRWQYTIFLFTWIEGVLIGFHHLSSVFLGFTPEHWCSLEEISFPGSWSQDQRKNYSIPLNLDKGKLDQCQIYDIRGKSIPDDYAQALSARTNTIVKCSSWDYSRDMGWTTVSEWDLVCDRTALLSTVQGSYMGGVFVGCIFWGWASDKFGRRPSILIASVIQIVSSIIAAFSVDYIMFIFFRFLIAFSVSGVFECGFVLVTEIVAPELRTPFGIMTQFPFGIGASLLPLVAYFIKNWTPLQLAISIPCCALISYYWAIPESPRWLIQAGKFKEALAVLKKAAATNKATLPSDEEMLGYLRALDVKDDAEETETEIEKTMLEKLREGFKEMEMLVRTPQMRKRTINIFFSWLVVAMVYYGLSFNTKNIGGNFYVSNFISGFAEVVACVVIIPALARYGRVKIYSGTFILGGISCIIVAIVLWSTKVGQLVWVVITFAMIGKFLIAGTFALAYLYTAELFPTPVRNVAVGGASTFARIGSMSAPYIVDILGKVSPGIPAIIFGVLSLLAGLSSLLLPETLNRKLPETVADVENWSRGHTVAEVEVELKEEEITNVDKDVEENVLED